MICFICKENFILLNDLAKHLHQMHLLGFNDEYICMESNCHMAFSNLRAFKYHIKNVHNKMSTTPTSQTNPVADVVMECQSLPSTSFDESVRQNILPEQTIDRQQLPNTSLNKPIVQNLQMPLSRIDLEEQALKFALTFYNINNMNMKDVSTIIQETKTQIIQPILYAIECFIGSIQIDPEIKIFLLSLRNPFQHFESNYMLFKHLEKKT